MSASRPASPPTVVLDLHGESTPIPVLLRDLVAHWRLLPMLASRDYRGRYRSASLGLAWSVLLPMLQGAVMAVVFTRFVRIQTEVPYPVFVITGIVTWSYVNQSLATSSTSIVETGALAGRIYFPRLILPAVPIASNLISFAISMAVVVVLAFGFGANVGWPALLLPAAMAWASLLVYGIGSIGSLLHVYYRDTRYVVSATMLVLFYATPVIYPLTLVDRAPQFKPLIIANPMTGIVQLMRWCVLGQVDGGLAWPLVSTALWTVLLIGVGLLAFRRHERIAVDRL